MFSSRFGALQPVVKTACLVQHVPRDTYTVIYLCKCFFNFISNVVFTSMIRLPEGGRMSTSTRGLLVRTS